MGLCNRPQLGIKKLRPGQFGWSLGPFPGPAVRLDLAGIAGRVRAADGESRRGTDRHHYSGDETCGWLARGGRRPCREDFVRATTPWSPGAHGSSSGGPSTTRRPPRPRLYSAPRAAVAQLARASACHAEGRGFESHQPLSRKESYMGLLRRRHGPDGTRYRMREKLFAIGDDFWIDTEDDRHAFKFNGKALRLRSTFVLETPSGEALLKIQEKKLRIRGTMELERDGQTIGTVKKALISPLRARFTIDLGNGRELTAKGNIVDHEYEIERDGDKIAEISKRWFRIRDSYGIEVAPGADDALIVAAAVCIDEMTHD